MSFEQEVRIRQLEDELRLVRARFAVVNDRYCYVLGALGGVGDCPAEEELIEEEANASSIVETYKKAQSAQRIWAELLEYEQMGMTFPEDVEQAQHEAEGLWARYRELRSN